MVQVRKSGGDVSSVLASWKQIVFVFDKFSEASDNDDYYELMDLITHIIKREHGMKVSVLALDTLDGISGDYSTAGRAVRNEQNGLLLCSLREQSVFGVNLPYGAPEKEFTFGDGYIIKKTRFSGIRAAL